MDLNNFKISIVMPCFNRLKLLDKSIKSILNQTYKNFEFIIVDDCSDLETNILLKKYRDSDSRIKVFFNKKNRGPTYSFNKGLYLDKVSSHANFSTIQTGVGSYTMVEGITIGGQNYETMTNYLRFPDRGDSVRQDVIVSSLMYVGSIPL